MDIFDTEITLVSIVLLISAAYFILIIIIFCFCIRFQPHRFIQSHKVCGLEEETSHAMASYLDCSCITKCCPCPAFSFRQFLKSYCFDSEKLRRNVNCECIRPAIHGSHSSEGLNFICCQVAGSS
ncbi:unnamed protein product [Cercopithifilaria johnstoni]|uniref:Uncharacterized protein n=1 Tax=Cercopithifilaria johnstoni TaxID=2874296 RepID=A0A8J2M2M9_9BILA|nr:unnamed protein product [Cercopithifilaria johnstoni]